MTAFELEETSTPWAWTLSFPESDRWACDGVHMTVEDLSQLRDRINQVIMERIGQAFDR